MMSMYVRFLVLLFQVVVFSHLLSSCIYDTDVTFKNKVKEIEDPNLEVVNFDLSDDTVYTYGLNQVKFHFSSNSNRIQGVRMLIDNVLIQTIESENGFFDFQALELKDGLHKLVIEVHTATNTGSIADKLNAESLVLSKEYVLIADAKRKRDIGFTVDNGFLKLHWEAYKGSDIASYKVIMNNYDLSELLIGNYSNTSLIDSSYVGQARTYYVKVIKKNGTELYWAGYNVPANGLPKLSVITTSDNEHMLHWTKGKYYNAISQLKVYVNSNSPSVHSPNDSVYKFNVKFTEPINAKIEIVPLKPISQANYSIEQNAYGGIVSVLHKYDYELDTYSVSADVFAYFFADTVFYYSTSANKFSKKVCVDTGDKSARSGHYLSPSANYIHFKKSTNVYEVVDLMSLERFKVDNMQAYTGNFIQSFVISDVGTGYIRNLNKYNVLFDYRMLKPIKYHFFNSQSVFDMRMSSDGNFIAMNGVDSMCIVQLNVPSSVSTKQVWSRKTNSYYKSTIEFSTANRNQFLHWSDDKITIYQLSPIVQIRQFEMNEQLINVDYFQNQFLTYEAGSLNVRSLLDGSLIENIAIYSGNSNLFKLHNHKVYFSNRYIYNSK